MLSPLYMLLVPLAHFSDLGIQLRKFCLLALQELPSLGQRLFVALHIHQH